MECAAIVYVIMGKHALHVQKTVMNVLVHLAIVEMESAVFLNPVLHVPMIAERVHTVMKMIY